MKREIKFRAWDKILNKWYYDDEYIMVCHDKIFFKFDGELWKLSKADCVYQQFTGLKDKNGTEIYGGDILSGWKKGSNSDRSYMGVIEWRTEQAGWIVKCGKFIMEILSLAMSGDGIDTTLDSFEIIGNLYTTPELLNKDK